MFWDRRSFVKRLVSAFAVGKAMPDGRQAQQAPSSGQSHGQPPPVHAGQPRSTTMRRGYIRPGTIEVLHRQFDVIVVGGGIAGTCAAISAARNGSTTALVHERSVLGGNSSSEVRLFPEDTCGFSTWIKESGVLEEICAEERARNWEPYIEGLMNSHWDLVLYEWVTREKNLTLFLNSTMREVEMADAAHIHAIHAIQLGTEKTFVLHAPLFVDATGDGVLGYRAGADFRWGQEARSEYHERLAPEHATDAGMGNTLFFRARDTGKPVPFKRPEWAVEFPSESDLTARDHGFIEAGYWWIEVGYPLHPIRDNEEIRHEALRQLLGLWDHIKNRCEHRARAETYALEFVGFWPYKRESRRILGDYVLREPDVRTPAPRNDDIAYGCWGIDIHVPGGILKRAVPPYPPARTDSNWETLGTIPYGIPLRSCYSRNVRNLLMAGRPISASYVAFASSRVLPTGAVVGQAVGVAAALCKKHSCDPRRLARDRAGELQQLLLRQDGFIPGVENRDPLDLARDAHVIASSEASLIFPESQSFHAATFPLAQLFPVSSDRLEAVELLLKSTLPAPATVTVTLQKASHVWDFRSSREIARASAVLPAHHEGFVRFMVNARTEPGSLYYASIDAQPGVAWGQYSDKAGDPSLVPVGTTAADRPGPSSWRGLTNGRCFSLRTDPDQRPYSAQNVVRGANRPDRWTNVFVSDPAQPFSAWIELQLPRSTRFTQVQVTFDTDVNRRIRLPLFRSPECVKRYDIAVSSAGAWRQIADVSDNYQRRRVHTFSPVNADRVRITVHETNGAKSARIYEVRLYNE